MKRGPAVDLGESLPLSIRASAKFVPSPRFTDFCAQIDVTLEPGQRVACLVAFDGVDPVDLSAEGRVLARQMFGDVDRIEAARRAIIVAVCGARGGKTYVFGALRLLHLALTVDISMLAPGEVASGPLIAPDMDLATQALRFVQGAIASHPALRKMVLGKPDAAESIDLIRDGRIIEIVVRSASGKGRTGRGRSLFGAVMEESAFFHDKDYAVNDAEIFRAITPRLLPGAQLIVSSTPWAQVGLLFDLFVANHPNPECAGADASMLGEESDIDPGTAIAFHAPTLLLRSSETIRAMVAREYALDGDNAAREYGAQFMSASAETFFDAATLAKCIDASLALPTMPLPGDEVTSGGDLGFSKNSSALVIAHRRDVIEKTKDPDTGKDVETTVNRITVADIREKKPQEGAALKPSEVCKEFTTAIAAHHGSFLMADGHYKATAIEHLTDAGLAFVEAPVKPADAFIATRAAMREGRVKLPNHGRLLKQLRETMAKRGSAGTITIVLPKWKTGEHGDIASAFVLAVYQAAGERVPAPKPIPGTTEAFEAEAAASREKRRAAVRNRYEGGDSFVKRWPSRT